MSSPNRHRVLLIDDEPNVLEGLQDMLRRSFDTVLAVGGHQGVERLENDGPFAVVVSDLRMPVLNGSKVLAIARQKAPETTRMLLTGCADITAAIDAVNNGHIFRFLTKPCPKETLLQALVAGVAQHRLVAAERVVIEETLRGAVEALAGTLALANPTAFGRATRLRGRASRLASAAGLENAWEVEIAAMLSQIGCLSLPAETAGRYYFGEALTASEQALVDDIPRASCDVISGIPRLEGVCEILRGQHLVGGAGAVSRRAQALRIVHDADVLETQGLEPRHVAAALRSRGFYDDDLLDLFAAVSDCDGSQLVLELTLGHVTVGMTFVRDVTSPTGALLVPRGHTVTAPLLERIAHLPTAIRGLPTIVVAPADGTPPDTPSVP